MVGPSAHRPNVSTLGEAALAAATERRARGWDRIVTLMPQQVLARREWRGRLTDVDRRALMPLIWEHVNPYGRYELDTDSCLPLA